MRSEIRASAALLLETEPRYSLNRRLVKMIIDGEKVGNHLPLSFPLVYIDQN